MARNIREPIPLPVILAASEGDERALNAVLNHYTRAIFVSSP